MLKKCLCYSLNKSIALSSVVAKGNLPLPSRNVKPQMTVPGKLDLHLHTTFSDGILDPTKLVEKAYTNGVRYLAITDHDCLAGLPAAEEKAESLGMTLTNGVELNTHGEGEEVHILGYGFDRDDRVLVETLSHQRADREVRFKQMIEKLNLLGFNLD